MKVGDLTLAVPRAGGIPSGEAACHHWGMPVLRARLPVSIVVLLALALGLVPALARADGSSDAPFEPDTVLVAFHPSVSRAERERAVARVGGKARSSESLPGVERVELPPGSEVQTAAATLSALPGVEYAEPNFLVHAALIPNDPSFSAQWSLARIELPAAWDRYPGGFSTGRPVPVAVVDSGIDLAHPELAPMVDRGRSRNFRGSTDDLADGAGHGTHVSGILAARANNGAGIAGVAPNARLLVLKVLDRTGVGTTADVAEAVTWAVQHGVRIVNLSLSCQCQSQTLASAISAAARRNAVVVAAAGNDGSTRRSYPAGYPGVIAVTASDRQDRIPAWANQGSWVTLAAPGVAVLSTVPGGGYQAWDGTSFAAPHVSGVAALLLGQSPTRSAGAIRSVLVASADRIGAGTPRDRRGAATVLRRLNASRALTQASGGMRTRSPRASFLAVPLAPAGV